MDNMTRLVLNIKNERRLPFLMDLLSNFDFLEVEKSEKIKFSFAEKKMRKGLKKSIEEMEKAESGKLKLKSWAQLRKNS